MHSPEVTQSFPNNFSLLTCEKKEQFLIYFLSKYLPFTNQFYQESNDPIYFFKHTLKESINQTSLPLVERQRIVAVISLIQFPDRGITNKELFDAISNYIKVNTDTTVERAIGDVSSENLFYRKAVEIIAPILGSLIGSFVRKELEAGIENISQTINQQVDSEFLKMFAQNLESEIKNLSTKSVSTRIKRDESRHSISQTTSTNNQTRQLSQAIFQISEFHSLVPWNLSRARLAFLKSQVQIVHNFLGEIGGELNLEMSNSTKLILETLDRYSTLSGFDIDNVDLIAQGKPNSVPLKYTQE
jgi:hypothetical protein